MKLIRFGNVGHEKPGILLKNEKLSLFLYFIPRSALVSDSALIFGLPLSKRP